MKIEIIKTLKGATVWKKGTVFDDAVAPIPGNILNEVRHGSKAVRVISAEKPIAEIETEIENEDTVAEPTSPAPETDRASEVPQENTPKFTFPELEGLIEKNTSVKEVAVLLGVSYPTVLKWRSGKSKPKAKTLRKIRREFKKVNADDQNRTDRQGPI